MTREQARDIIIATAEVDEDGADLIDFSRPCNYVSWSLDLIESTLRGGGFPTLEDLENTPFR